MDEGQDGLFDGTEVTAEAEVYACEDAVEYIGAEVLGTEDDHLGFIIGK